MSKRCLDRRGIQGWDTSQFFTLNRSTLLRWGKTVTGTGYVVAAGFWGQWWLPAPARWFWAGGSALYLPPGSCVIRSRGPKLRAGPAPGARLWEEAVRVPSGRQGECLVQKLGTAPTSPDWTNGKREVLLGRRRGSRFLPSSWPDPALTWSTYVKQAPACGSWCPKRHQWEKTGMFYRFQQSVILDVSYFRAGAMFSDEDVVFLKYLRHCRMAGAQKGWPQTRNTTVCQTLWGSLWRSVYSPVCSPLSPHSCSRARNACSSF